MLRHSDEILYGGFGDPNEDTWVAAVIGGAERKVSFSPGDAWVAGYNHYY